MEPALNCYFTHITITERRFTNRIDFVHKVITYIENNGYMEDLSVLLNPPFEKPISFPNLFDGQKRMELRDAIQKVKENALIAKAQ